MVRYFLKRARPDSLPTRGSRVELALGQTAAALQSDGVRHASVVLLSDGHAPYWAQQPQLAALSAYGSQYQLLTVGMGTPQGGVIHDDHAVDGVLHFRNQRVRAPLYERQLRSVTEQLGGQYWRYDNGSALIAALKQRIADFSGRHATHTHEWVWHSLRSVTLLGALAFLVWAFWPVQRRRR